MSKILYTSDVHFHHQKVAGNRGFETPEEHDAVIIQNWNSAVRRDDIVWVLGDFAMIWAGVHEKLCALNGRKVLVTGNHDIMWGQHRDGWKSMGKWIGEGKFEAILGYGRRKVGRREFLMSHFPYTGDGKHSEVDRHTQFRLRDEGMWLLHGHTHSSEKLSAHPRQVHVGMDAWGLAPAEEEHVLALMRDEK